MCARTPTHSPAAGGDGEGDSDNDDDDFFTTLRPCDTPAQSHSDACRASYSHKSTSCSSPYPPSLCMHTLTPSSLPANSRQQPGLFQRRNTSSSHGRPSQGREFDSPTPTRWLTFSVSLMLACWLTGLTGCCAFSPLLACISFTAGLGLAATPAVKVPSLRHFERPILNSSHLLPYQFLFLLSPFSFFYGLAVCSRQTLHRATVPVKIAQK